MTMTIKTCGHPIEDLVVNEDELITQCGRVRDGIKIAWKGKRSWVIDYLDLEELYIAATKERFKRGKEESDKAPE